MSWLRNKYCYEKTGLNPLYTFNSFIVAPSNRYAYCASAKVAIWPGKAYNPLLIYGGSGVGKTHLLNAIGNYIFFHHPKLCVQYITTEKLLFDLANQIRRGNIEIYRKSFKNLDILLIDDVHFLLKREKAAEETIRLIDSSYKWGIQIVMTCSDFPESFLKLKKIIYKSMLSVELKPPCYETKIAYVKRKCEEEKISLPEKIIEFMARNIKDDIRALAGAIKKIKAYGSIKNISVEEILSEQTLEKILYEYLLKFKKLG
ncbi:MAG: DnaA/Hda family protein [Candidatus Aminicenantes bacterium]|nr:DnaA/Hda family protein [Candidatus Aminicenantes bacterium]